MNDGSNAARRTTIQRRLKVLSVIILFLVLLAIGFALKLHREVPVSRSPGGDVIRLEGHAFAPGSVRYDVPNRPIARALGKALPDAAKRGMPWLRPEATVFATGQ